MCMCLYDVVIPRNWLKKGKTIKKAPPRDANLSLGEKWLWIVIIAGILLIVAAQVATKRAANEAQLKRDLAYKEFLAGGQLPGDWRLAYVREVGR